jgi:hypothetical protein
MAAAVSSPEGFPMDAERFDTLTRALTTTGSRRRALAAVLGSALAFREVRRGQAFARETKVTICHQSDAGPETISVAAAAVQKHLDHGDQEGPCPPGEETGDACAGETVACGNPSYSCFWHKDVNGDSVCGSRIPCFGAPCTPGDPCAYNATTTGTCIPCGTCPTCFLPCPE